MRALVIVAVLALVCGCMSTPEPAATSPAFAANASQTSTTVRQGGRLRVAPQPTEVTETTQPDPCQLKRQALRQSIKKLGYCTVNSDCKVAQLFRCYSLINVNADTSQVARDAIAYNQSCKLGPQDCDQPPTQAEIVCEDGACSEVRIPPSTTPTLPRRKRTIYENGTVEVIPPNANENPSTTTLQPAGADSTTETTLAVQSNSTGMTASTSATTLPATGSTMQATTTLPTQ